MQTPDFTRILLSCPFHEILLKSARWLLTFCPNERFHTWRASHPWALDCLDCLDCLSCLSCLDCLDRAIQWETSGVLGSLDVVAS
jgi:hypothetical protein